MPERINITLYIKPLRWFHIKTKS